jgi:UDP-N-acetyl-D-mannosaminuronate dehydrogenase
VVWAVLVHVGGGVLEISSGGGRGYCLFCDGGALQGEGKGVKIGQNGKITRDMKIVIVNLGYMELPMTTILTRTGHKILGMDTNPHVMENVNTSACPFEEPGMKQLMAKTHGNDRLRATAKPAITDTFVLSLPTPINHHTHKTNIRSIKTRTRSITPMLNNKKLIILENTSPTNTTRHHVKEMIKTLRPKLTNQIDYVFYPKRAIPGNTLHKIVENDHLMNNLTPRTTEHTITLYKTSPAKLR